MLTLCLCLSACRVGPEFQKPESSVPEYWSEVPTEGLSSANPAPEQWWLLLEDPVLNNLLNTARSNNNTLQIAALRVLESQAQLGIASGQKYPQTQIAAGNATYVSPAANSGSTRNYWGYGLGATAAWEIDFWGRFERGIEASDAAYLASIAAYDQAQVILSAAVVGTYVNIRLLEEQLRIARENADLQQRSYDIAQVLFENGADSELDMQQANTLLLSTLSTVPALEVGVKQARNALSTLLGLPPGSVAERLAAGKGLPAIPDEINIGLPADALRRRPDVRQAEFNAMAANALVGLAETDLYPSFSLTGSIGVAAGGPGNSDFGDLFDTDAITWSVGPSFVWPFLNYGRIKNNIRVQDAVLQQTLVNYRETTLQAAREAEDAMAAFIGARAQNKLLEQTVQSALRSNQLSTLRYAEGFSDYERVLNAQQALFSQQQRYVTNQGDSVLALVALYKALGGGWEQRAGKTPEIDPEIRKTMRERTDWDGWLDDPGTEPGSDEANHDAGNG